MLSLPARSRTSARRLASFAAAETVPTRILGLILVLALTIAILGLTCLAASGQETDSAQGSISDLPDGALLQMLDDARFTDTASSITILVAAQTSDEVKEATLRLRFKTLDDQTYSRIEFLAPDELAGQVYLTTPDASYFIGPDLDFPLQVQPTNAVFGDAAVAQTSGIRFVEEYTVVERRSIAADGGRTILELDLEAVDFTVAFQLATVRVDPETGRALSVVLYAISGLPFYEVFYEVYDSLAVEGSNAEDEYARVQRIVNLLLVGNVTTTEILEASNEELPDSLFDPGRLADRDPAAPTE